MRGVPRPGEALGFGELVGGYTAGAGVANPDRPSHPQLGQRTVVSPSPLQLGRNTEEEKRYRQHK